MELLEREPLLAQLAGLFDEARHGHGRIALVAGEAGIGKTAVVEAFCARQTRSAQLLWGSCDAVVPPRPFAPLADMADQEGGKLREALNSRDRNGVFDAFLGLVREPGSQKVVVFEDLQWADEATLDLLRVLGRRLRDLPALIIGTFRDDEVGSEHPLRLALGDVPAREIANLPVPPLTAAAVKTLTGSSGIDAEALHAATAGNPFFVTEVVAEGGDKLPTTIRDTVLARVARLSPPAAHALRAAAVIGQRCEPRLLQDVADCDASVLAECLSRGMLQQEGLMLRFRHELAQRALYEGLAPAERAALHGRALKAIRRRVVTADPAELAYHALEAGDAETVIELAPVAAERATELGAHREAAAHYGTALLFSQAMEEGSRAELLENHARECFMADNVEGALTSQQEALECWHRLGNVRREGDCLRALSSMLWYAGDGIRARETAESAARLLESVSSPVPELARAYATVAQLHLDGGHDHSIVLAFGERALGLAERLGDEPVTIHALNTIGTAEICMGRERGWSKLQESLKRAKIAGLHDDAARALANLVVESKIVRRYELFDQYFDEAIVYTADHGLDLYRRYLLGELAEVTLERGRWEAAAESALALLAQSRTANLIRVKALTVLGRLQARRGESGCWSLLDESLDMAGRRGDLFDLCPLYAARAEAAWLEGNMVQARREGEIGLALALQHYSPWWRGELGFWMWKAGGLNELPDGSAKPYVLHATGQYREAAKAWQAIGCPYQQALAMADTASEDDLRQALVIFHSLGAHPAASQLTRRLHAMGARDIPRGPRPPTRRNPAGLTARELEVLNLLAEGLRNVDIAERLVVSSKTVDHHVSAILSKLGAPNRVAAVEKAALLRLQDGEIVSAR